MDRNTLSLKYVGFDSMLDKPALAAICLAPGSMCCFPSKSTCPLIFYWNIVLVLSILHLNTL